MKLFESVKITKLTEAVSMDDMRYNSDKIRTALEKIVDVKKHGFNVKAYSLVGDPVISISFSKYREEDKKWASGQWRNDPALFIVLIQEARGGLFQAELVGSSSFLNFKKILGGYMPKKTGTIDQIIKHMEKYLSLVVSNIDKFE